MIRPAEWDLITDDEPEEGRKVLLWNGIRILYMNAYKAAIKISTVPAPVTHYCYVDFKAKAPDLTNVDKVLLRDKRNREKEYACSRKRSLKLSKSRLSSS